MRRIISILLLLLSVAVVAQAAHITDKLQVELYQVPGGTGRVLRLLPSGTPVEVLGSRDAYNEVRLGDNSTGWVESRLVSNKKPTKIRLLELQAKSGKLQQRLMELERRLEAMEGTRHGIPIRKVAADSGAYLPGGEASCSFHLHVWHLPVAIVLLMLGFLGGIAFSHSRSLR
ncbi:MAG: TIGR04211 family SH3 domain-containing protein [Gammaproteobacteria bacterium]|nr:TIGR04211 family SH3 domain-containing protein [Gammaproteobacteria bacterium]